MDQVSGDKIDMFPLVGLGVNVPGLIIALFCIDKYGPKVCIICIIVPPLTSTRCISGYCDMQLTRLQLSVKLHCVIGWYEIRCYMSDAGCCHPRSIYIPSI